MHRKSRGRPAKAALLAVGAAALATTVGLGFAQPVLAQRAAETPFLSEIHYDNAGTDSGEAVEVQAPAGFDLTGWQIVLYNGNGGAPYHTATLSGVVPAAGVVVQNYPANGIQNGAPDGFALVRADGTVAEFLSYEGVFAAVGGPANGQTGVDIGVSEPDNTPAGQSLQKIDGTWRAPAASSFGALNSPTQPEEPEEPGAGCETAVTHTIAQVQGTGAATPLAGTRVTVEGVVTADHRTGGYNGAYIQTAGSGGEGARTASDGVFVYFGTTAANHPSISIGDQVKVSGNAAEFNGLTQIVTAAKGDTAVCATGAPLPAPVPLTLPLDAAARETAEGMLVAPVGEYTVSDVYNTNRFGEIVLAAGDEPLRIPTDVARPGSADALALKAENAARRILIDDARTTNLADAGQAPPYLAADAPVRVGDRVEKFGAGVLSWGFNEWRVQPTTPVDANTPAAGRTTFKVTNPRTPGPENVGGDIRVASFNVLNYFVHFGGEARGAADAAALAKQQAKIVSAISALDADVVALMEIENSVRFNTAEPQQALRTLVDALNAKDGAGTWDYVRTPADLPPAAQQDVITGAIIFKPGAVTPQGASRSVNDESVWFNAREPIAQTFTSGSLTFTVVSNHFKSKSTSDAATGDNADSGDGQGAFNGDRKRQAAALAAFVDSLDAENVLLLGDFNSYSQEDPLQVLYDAGYANLDNGEDGSSYVFGGESGSLDHAIASGSLVDRVTGVDIWNINAVESYAYQYDGFAPFYSDGPYRSSDHDPVVVGLNTGSGAGPVDLQLLSINDFHGRLEQPSAGNGGAAQLVGMINALRAQNPNTAWVSAGDNIGASTFISAIDDDNPTIDVLNAGGLAVSAVGNHEFDKGLADLLGRVEDRADFPYLAANVYSDGARVLPGYSVQELGGVKVGYIGVVTEQTASLVSPDGIVGVEFRDPVAETNLLATELSDGNEANGEADVLVLLAHEGAATENIATAEALQADPVFGDFTRVSAEIDAIFSGHTHQPYAFQVPVPGTDRTRPVIQAQDYGLKVGQANLTYDPATDSVTASSGQLLTVNGYPQDAAVAAIVAQAKVTAEELGKQPLGSITADIKRAVSATGSEDRGAESALGNFIADVQLDQTSAPGRGGAQIAFMNPGGLRADLLYAPDGVVTYSEAFSVQPFSNDVVTKTYTGAQIKQALEEQWQPAGASRPKLHLGVSKGLTYSYDAAQPQGSRIIASTLKLNGTVLDPAGLYRVTVNSFLASGGDNFVTLGQGTDRVTTGDNDLTMLVNYLAANSPVTADTTPRTTPGTAAPDDTVAPTGSYHLGVKNLWAGQSVRLTQDALADDVSTPAQIEQVVDWGDGSEPQTLDAGAVTVTHTYAEVGSYRVTVRIADAAGNEAAAAITGGARVTVTEQPTGRHVLSPKTIWESESVSLSTSALTGAGRIVIDWGDGSTGTRPADGRVVKHIYTEPGTYAVTLTPYNPAGAGTPVEVGSVTVKADTVAPVVRLDEVKKADTLKGWVTDNGSGAAEVTVKLIQKRDRTWFFYDGTAWTAASTQDEAAEKATAITSVPNANGRWTVAVQGVEAGNLKISYSATDRAGNTSQVRTESVQIIK